MTRKLALAQGVDLAATGVWPLVHMQSFEMVTGPKVDKWLVRTVGVLIATVGGVLVSAAVRNRVTAEVGALAVGSAAGLGAIDTIYASRGRISQIYLADALLEGALVAAWAAGVAAGAAGGRAPRPAFGRRTVVEHYISSLHVH